jgi:hypothetical protein
MIDDVARLDGARDQRRGVRGYVRMRSCLRQTLYSATKGLGDSFGAIGPAPREGNFQLERTKSV